MPKTKRTRKQKLQSDERKKVLSSEKSAKAVKRVSPKARTSTDAEPTPQSSSTYSLPTAESKRTPHKTEPALSSKVLTKGYDYLTKDLWKTSIVTSAIVLVQLLIYFTQ